MSFGPLRCRTVTVLLSLVLLPGCSWLTVTKPPSGPLEPAPPVECTSSSGAPTLDWIGAVTLGFVSAGTIAWGASGAHLCIPISLGGTSTGSGSCPNGPTDWGVVAVGIAGVAGSVALGFSGAYGVSHTAECRALTETQLSCTSGVEQACRSLNEGKPYTKPPEAEQESPGRRER